MTEEYIGVYSGNQEEFFIVELSAKDVVAIAQSLHMLIADNPDNEAYYKALHRLVDQANYVSLNAGQHDVFTDIINVRDNTVKAIDKIYYKPVDLYD